MQICDAAKTMAKAECEEAKRFHSARTITKADRSMRESGFDISFRFGPYGAATHHYAPICLNSLLYKTEKDLQADGGDRWGTRMRPRNGCSARTTGKTGSRSISGIRAAECFFDYNFETGVRSIYEYITTFYPLWAGLATPEQAQELVANLGIFEQPGGLAMSSTDADVQWDYPYGWAPTQIVAIEGLRRYGFNDDANRISYNFLSTIAENFRRDGTIREKYNVVTRVPRSPASTPDISRT